MPSRPRYVVEAIESDTSWVLTVQTAGGSVVHEVDKHVSFLDLFDQVQKAVATFTAAPVTSFYLRFSLAHHDDRDSSTMSDEAGT